MKNILFSLFVIAVINALSSCKAPVTGATSHLVNKWVHSYEETTNDGSEIYRPANYKKFPPGMFRQVYDLKANGRCEYLVLHPADAHYMAKGKWQYNDSSKVLSIISTDGKTVAEYEVPEAKRDLMRLKKI